MPNYKQVFAVKSSDTVDENKLVSPYSTPFEIKLYVIYFKLLHSCPKARRFRKDDGWLTSQGFCFPRISICFPKYYIFW